MTPSSKVTPGVTHIRVYHRPYDDHECFFNKKVYFKERSHVNLLSSWMRFLTYDICLYDISKHLWFYTPCNTHSIGNLDAQYGQLQHGGICRSSSWRSFGKPGSARVLLLLPSPAPSSQRSGRPVLGKEKVAGV